jgi:antitoxin (DNA-binding transcriptional repressor) of toxin-antitoxin stability system
MKPEGGQAAAARLKWLDIFRTVRTVLSMKKSMQQISKGAEEARQQLPAILAAAAAGRTTIITRHGRAVAAVVPVTAVKAGKPAALQALAGTGRGMWGKNSTKAIARLRDEWNR